ncbi:MAG: VWA domain-containing protein [Rhizobiales bacterium]|nr:VWA domain-containing protein [Hyphomicrobiales bacterium]
MKPEAFPDAARAFLEFPQVLRAHRFAIAGGQALAFMAATPLLAPLNLRRLHRAAHATLAPPPERHAEFDALFHAYFSGGGAGVVAAKSLPEHDAPVSEGLGTQQAIAELRKLSESGKSATQSEALGIRHLRGQDEKPFARTLCSKLPHRLRLRQERMPHGPRLDLRRSLSDLVANDGDLVALARSGRKSIPRRTVLLIDISGSMKAETDSYLDLAYELTREFRDTETFAFGTRLTRLTHALRIRSKEAALVRASDLVADWDGGTRIGAAFDVFLSNPRLAGLAHGAIVVVISDGLERGDHNRMVEAVRRLDRRARHLLWLSPLAGDPRYKPETAAIKAILPIVGRIADGSTSEMVIHSLVSLQNDRRREAS